MKLGGNVISLGTPPLGQSASLVATISRVEDERCLETPNGFVQHANWRLTPNGKAELSRAAVVERFGMQTSQAYKTQQLRVLELDHW
jgi:hypothetical protein